MKIAIGADHAGYELKEHVKVLVRAEGHDVEDFGTNDSRSVDFPDYGFAVAEHVAAGNADRGILVCGTGIGMSVTANRVRGVRAALVYDLFGAEMSRRHTDANILVLAGRMTGKGLAEEIVRTWLATPFEGERHKRRIDKMDTR